MLHRVPRVSSLPDGPHLAAPLTCSALAFQALRRRPAGRRAQPLACCLVAQGGLGVYLLAPFVDSTLPVALPPPVTSASPSLIGSIRVLLSRLPPRDTRGSIETLLAVYVSEIGVSDRFETHLQLETPGFFCVSVSPSGLGWLAVS